MAVDTDIHLADGDHVVQFYASEDELGGSVAGYLASAVADGDTAILIAVPEHVALFERALEARGVEVARARAAGRLVVLDAAQTLSEFMVDGVAHPAAFDEVVGGLVRGAVAGGGGRVRAYGEMVAVLWEAGLVTAAIEVERLWNRLAEEAPFSLLCAYPSDLVSGPDAAAAFSSVCHLHSDVVAGAPALPEAEVSRRFAGTAEAPRLARRFAAETLRAWDLAALLDDAVLVIAELTANAVRHARSDVTVGLSRNGARVRIHIGDSSPAPPTPRTARPMDVGGRGLLLVDRVARAWGHGPAARRGKVVWVDLVLTPGEA